ncbi:MAG: NYN domain-containing protein [Clostridiales bacterium]|nr:NYN domain-containing protein [Clostridiales bacterium]MDY6116948.1 NYN domain-containing protein [Anaerovoracaceae bacterium]
MKFNKFNDKVAILVDGGFYRRRAQSLWGQQTSDDRIDELLNYCYRHLRDKGARKEFELYRIFYYDCPPMSRTVYHPFLKKNIDFRHTPLYTWMTEFLEGLTYRRKIALRLGTLSDTQAKYTLDAKVLNKLCKGDIKVDDLKESDFRLEVKQKGVDMKIGVDIASIAYKHQVDKIILISGDSDFVPAAKLARREGIDFVLDPMRHKIKSELQEHVDGVMSCFSDPKKKQECKEKDSKEI